MTIEKQGMFSSVRQKSSQLILTLAVIHYSLIYHIVHTCLVCKQDSEKPMQKFSQKYFANLIKNKMCIQIERLPFYVP